MVMLLPWYANCGNFFNQAPIISEITVSKKQVDPLENVRFRCVAVDRDRDALKYDWSADGGIIKDDGPSAVWKAPKTPGSYTITARVKDSKGAETISQVMIDVLSNVNNAPIIDHITVRPKIIFEGKTTMLTCDAIDPDGDELAFTWEVKSGRLTGEGSKVTWTAPMQEGDYEIFCYATDSTGNQSRQSSATVKVICDCEGAANSEY